MLFSQMLIFVLASGPSPDAACSGPLTRQAVVECATAVSPRLRADRERVAAAEGDANAARVVLPSNPTASVTIGQRWNTVGDQSLNVSGTISQRIEIAGQRRKRKEAAQAEVRAHEHAAAATERDVVAEALFAYYDVLAARDELAVVERGHATALQLGEVASARTDAGLGTPIDGDLASAEAAALREQVALAQGRVRVAEARLASVLGLDPTATLPEVRGTLAPIPVPGGLRPATDAAHGRPEIAQREADREAHQARLRVLRRERAPSPSLSVFAQTDGFNERVVGGGLSFPIPLPFPLGRTNKGELQAAQARIREADARLDAEGRAVTLEATVAFHEYEAREQAAAAYTPASQATVRQSLGELSAQIERGRLPVRDALLTQQLLIASQLRAIESKHALCRAAVALALATGTRFEGGAR
jgi:cobalt-zinc-cadmium efflux system outer membrane protein